MKYAPQTLFSLFSDVSHKAKLTFEHSEVDTLAEAINHYNKAEYHKLGFEIDGKYLYDSYHKIKKAAENDLPNIGFNSNYINFLTKYLDLEDFNQYLVKVGQDEGSDEKTEQNTAGQKNDSSINIGKNINKIEGDMNDSIINNF